MSMIFGGVGGLSGIQNATLRGQQMAEDREHQHQREVQRTRAEELEERFERLLLVTNALWELLAERGGLAEEHLLAKMHEIDARDGVLDGTATRPGRTCPSCEAKLPPELVRCQFCGTEVASGADPFVI
jgi:hypothetical protein